MACNTQSSHQNDNKKKRWVDYSDDDSDEADPLWVIPLIPAQVPAEVPSLQQSQQQKAQPLKQTASENEETPNKEWDMSKVADTQGIVGLVDNANVFISGKKWIGDPAWRLNMRGLKEIVLARRDSENFIVFATRNQCKGCARDYDRNEEVWKAYKEVGGVSVDISEPSIFTNKEKTVDCKVQSQMIYDSGVMRKWSVPERRRHRPCYILLGGDRDYSHAVSYVLNLGISVEVWVFPGSEAQYYKDLEKEFQEMTASKGKLSLNYLSTPGTFERIGFCDQMPLAQKLRKMKASADRTIVFSSQEMGTQALVKKVERFCNDLTMPVLRTFKEKDSSIFVSLYTSDKVNGESIIMVDKFFKEARRAIGSKSVFSVPEYQQVKQYKENFELGFVDLPPWAVLEEDEKQKSSDTLLTKGWQTSAVQVKHEKERDKRDRQVHREKNKAKRMGEVRCHHREFCLAGLGCQFRHNDAEVDVFSKEGGTPFKLAKTKKCDNRNHANLHESWKNCPNLHCGRGKIEPELCKICLVLGGHEKGCGEGFERDVLKPNSKKYQELEEKGYLQKK